MSLKYVLIGGGATLCALATFGFLFAKNKSSGRKKNA